MTSPIRPWRKRRLVAVLNPQDSSLLGYEVQVIRELDPPAYADRRWRRLEIFHQDRIFEVIARLAPPQKEVCRCALHPFPHRKGKKCLANQL